MQEHFAAGMTAGCLSSFTTTPLDVVKTRIMTGQVNHRTQRERQLVKEKEGAVERDRASCVVEMKIKQDRSRANMHAVIDRKIRTQKRRQTGYVCMREGGFWTPLDVAKIKS